MAFKATNLLPVNALADAKVLALRAKSFANGYSAAFAASTTPRSDVLACYDQLWQLRNRLNTIRQTPGLGPYAAEQENDANYNVATEFTSLLNAIDAVTGNIFSTFPKDGNAFLLEKKFAVTNTGAYDVGTFTSAQLNTLRGLLDAVAAQVA